MPGLLENGKSMNSKTYNIKVSINNKFLESLELLSVQCFTEKEAKRKTKEKMKRLLEILIEEGDMDSLFRYSFQRKRKTMNSQNIPKLNEWYLRD